ncbi:MAG: DUF342 domain-containing protein [Clostridiales bacterium]|nr:DUF342 domain-containing protein [Clostridiales bacterium]
MSGTNAYFQLVIKEDGTYIKLYGAEPGGQPLVYDEISKYLIDKRIYEYDKIALGKAMATLRGVSEAKLSPTIALPQDEYAKVIISDDRMYAKCRFYPPSTGKTKGGLLTKDDIISALSRAGVKYGVDESKIDMFLRNRKYCSDYILAKATPPIQGHDAVITYHFNTDLTAKPTTNEDGSVDFHKLNIICNCKKDDLLATLTPVDYGKPGIDVCGKVIRPNKVNNRVLRHGNKVRISEDGLQLFADVDGHVSLTDGRVFVSDTYEVPADVDPSTGDIEYEGNVVVRGNVIIGFSVKAKGDIEVYGVVEGAYLEAGGQIILRRGMQGMNKGVLKAYGNIVSKFIENAEVIAGGYVTTDSIMHSNVSAKGDIIVSGRRGLITGGVIRSGTMISVKTAGSHMGTNTVLEVGIDPKIMDEFRELEKQIAKMKAEKEKIAQALAIVRKKLQSGGNLPYNKLESLKQITQTSIQLDTQIAEANARYNILRVEVEANEAGVIRVEDTVYSGTKIIISNVIYYVRDTVKNSKFIRDRADIKVLPLY